jgi:hypothetical protein
VAVMLSRVEALHMAAPRYCGISTKTRVTIAGAELLSGMPRPPAGRIQ